MAMRIPVCRSMYLLKCTCVRLCGRSAMPAVPISFSVIGRGPEAFGTVKHGLEVCAFCPSHWPCIFKVAMIQLPVVLIFQSCLFSFSVIFAISFCHFSNSTVSSFSVTLLHCFFCSLRCSGLRVYTISAIVLCHIIHLRTKLLPCEKNVFIKCAFKWCCDLPISLGWFH